MFTKNEMRAKSSSILSKTNCLLDMNLKYNERKEKKRRGKSTNKKKSVKPARSLSQPGIGYMRSPSGRKSIINYQPCLKKNHEFFEKAHLVYSDKIYSLKNKIETNDEDMKKLRKELKDSKITKQSFEEICEINSILIIKLRRLQYIHSNIEKNFETFKNKLESIFKILNKVEIKFTNRLKNIEESKERDIEILRSLNDLNLKQMNEKFQSLVEEIKNTREELGGENQGEVEFLRELNTKLIDKVNLEGENEHRKNTALIDLWKTKDDNEELKNLMRKMMSDFEKKEIEYKNEILGLKNRMKLKVKDEKKSMKIKVGREIESNLHQSTLLKNKIKNLSFNTESNFIGSKTMRSNRTREIKEKFRKGEKDGYVKGSYFEVTRKTRRREFLSPDKIIGDRNFALGVEGKCLEGSLGVKDADEIAESLLKGV